MHFVYVPRLPRPPTHPFLRCIGSSRREDTSLTGFSPASTKFSSGFLEKILKIPSRGTKKKRPEHSLRLLGQKNETVRNESLSTSSLRLSPPRETTGMLLVRNTSTNNEEDGGGGRLPFLGKLTCPIYPCVYTYVYSEVPSCKTPALEHTYMRVCVCRSV